MTKHVRASISFELPHDGIEEAGALATIAAAWKQFSDTVSSTGVTVYGQSFEMKRTLGPRMSERHRLELVRRGDAA